MGSMPMSPTVREAFPPTGWSLLAGFAAGGAARSRALADLAQRYWMPVYAYLRGKGRTQADAEDLVQSFFLHLMEGDLLARPDRSQGKFRSWLLAVLEHFLANEARFRGARKRGGGKKIVPLDSTAAEQAIERGRELAPHDAFNRTWAMETLQRAFARLETEMKAAGSQAVLARLRSRMGIAAVVAGAAEVSNVAVHRARKRLKELVLSEVRDSVRDPGDVPSEVADLFRSLGRSA